MRLQAIGTLLALLLASSCLLSGCRAQETSTTAATTAGTTTTGTTSTTSSVTADLTGPSTAPTTTSTVTASSASPTTTAPTTTTRATTTTTARVVSFTFFFDANFSAVQGNLNSFVRELHTFFTNRSVDTSNVGFFVSAGSIKVETRGPQGPVNQIRTLVNNGSVVLPIGGANQQASSSDPDSSSSTDEDTSAIIFTAVLVAFCIAATFVLLLTGWANNRLRRRQTAAGTRAFEERLTADSGQGSSNPPGTVPYIGSSASADFYGAPEAREHPERYEWFELKPETVVVPGWNYSQLV